EGVVNARIRANTDVAAKVMPKDDAIEAGAVALFGEKYGEEVRVVSMGGQDPGANAPWSMELCGGTHVQRTGDIGFFKITHEEGLAAGVRRIEAVAHQPAEQYVREQENTVREAAAALRATPDGLVERLNQLLDERKRLERDLAETRKKLATAGSGGGVETRDVGGVPFASRVVGEVPPKDLKPMADEMKKKLGTGVVAIAGSWEGKASLVVGVTSDLTNTVDAVQLVRVGSQALGGKGGGGRPDMAQAGGPNPDAGEDAVSAIASALSEAVAA
ncbi:alanyl-tRNA synthetase, partial [Limimonas halophila]